MVMAARLAMATPQNQAAVRGTARMITVMATLTTMGTTMTMTMTTEQLLTLTQWLSPAYPVGSFAFSHGIEMAVKDGQIANVADLENWLVDLLVHGAGRTDAILLLAAYGASDDDLADIADLASALQPSRERLTETLAQGAAFAATTRAVQGLDLPDMAYPVAIGRAARLVGLPAQPVAEVFLHAMMTNFVLAAQRLMPLGQTAAHRLLAGLAPCCAQVAADAAAATLDDIGSAAFAIDISAMRHETLEPRIFRS
jgi:urease accessory protein